MEHTEYSRDEYLKMTFRQYVELHSSYITQSIRIINAFCPYRDLNPYTVQDICKLTRRDLLRFRNIGNLAVNEIETILHLHGFSLGTIEEVALPGEDVLMAKLKPIIDEFTRTIVKQILNQK